MDFSFAKHPGEQLGMDSYDHLVEHAAGVCKYEQLRIKLANEPVATAKKAEYASELERYEELGARLYRAKPPHEHRARRRRIIYCWSVASILIAAGFALSLITLEPYQLGLKGILYCVGIAIATPFLVEVTLDKLSSEKLTRVLVTVSSVLALTSLMTLAVIRGELLAKHTQDDSAAVTFDNDAPTATEPSNTSFYKDTVPLLQIVMVLLAFAMEVGAGVAMHEAERVNANLGEPYEDLQVAYDDSARTLSQLAEDIMALQAEPERFAAQFWRDFHLAVLKRSIGNAAKVFTAASLAMLWFFCPPAKAQERPVNLVILVDLTKSVEVQGANGQSEFQQNLAAVSHVLLQVPPGAHVTVVGITDDSFGEPALLLSATVASDPGYFGEKLGAARRALEIAWKNRSRELNPSFPATDLIGALLVAGQIFQNDGASTHDVLVIFSDMWQETGELNFTRVQPCASDIMQRAKTHHLLANLRDADVYALGTDLPGKSKREWACVEDFWKQYFSAAGAVLREYSVLRSVSRILVADGYPAEQNQRKTRERHLVQVTQFL